MQLLLGTVVLGVGIDLLSLITWAHSEIAPWVMVMLLALVVALTFRSAAWGVVAILLELLWGSHGRLFVVPIAGHVLTVRMGLFVVAFFATVWHLRVPGARRALWEAVRTHPARWPLAAFLVSILVASVLGVLRFPLAQVVSDANAWGFLALLPLFLLARLPVVRDARRKNADIPIVLIVMGGVLYLIIRSYFLLFVFSHDLGGLWVPMYQWMRDTRLGEITVLATGFPRVFLPSMVLLFVAVPLAAQRIATDACQRSRISRMLAVTVFGGGIATLLISLSRSYWLAIAGLGAVGGVILGKQLAQHQAIPWRAIGQGIASALIAVAFAALVVRLPYPKPISTVGLTGAFAARFASDAAVSNRWQEIGPLRDAIRAHPLFGNGFGAAVTYETKDPRTLAAFPNGHYTTTALEWGYLDDWLERGIVGLAIELWLLAGLVWNGLYRNGTRIHPEGDVVPLSLGLLAIAIVHATSPYLNHPLGLGLLMLVFAAAAPRPPLAAERAGVDEGKRRPST